MLSRNRGWLVGALMLVIAFLVVVLLGYKPVMDRGEDYPRGSLFYTEDRLLKKIDLETREVVEVVSETEWFLAYELAPHPFAADQLFAFAGLRNEDERVEIWVMTGDEEFWSPTSGKTIGERPFSARRPVWMPDGRIAFLVTPEGNDYYLPSLSNVGAVDLHGEEEVELLLEVNGTPLWGYYGSPTWSPSGDLTLELTTRHEIQLWKEYYWSFLYLGEEPAWSSDGRLVFLQGNKVCVADETVDCHGGNAPKAYPTWSPENKWIAYTQFFPRGEHGDFDIYIMRSDGTGEPIRITDTPEINERFLAWVQ